MKNNKYKVEIQLINTYIIDIREKTEQQAEKKAIKKFNQLNANGTLHYAENEDSEIRVSYIYDVTNTDDPFNP